MRTRIALWLGIGALLLAGCGDSRPSSQQPRSLPLHEVDPPGVAPRLPKGMGGQTADIGYVEVHIKGLMVAQQRPADCTPSGDREQDVVCLINAHGSIESSAGAARDALSDQSQMVAADSPCRKAMVALDIALYEHEAATHELIKAIAAGSAGAAQAKVDATGAKWPESWARFTKSCA